MKQTGSFEEARNEFVAAYRNYQLLLKRRDEAKRAHETAQDLVTEGNQRLMAAQTDYHNWSFRVVDEQQPTLPVDAG